MNGASGIVFSIALCAIPAGTHGQEAPTVSAISDQVTDEDVPLPGIAFTVDDPDSDPSALTVSVASSNPGLAPAQGINVTGVGNARQLDVTSAANQSGTAKITITVTDPDGNSSQTEFALTVRPINDAPTISAIENQETTPGATVGPIPFFVADNETPLSALTITAASSDLQVIPTNGIAVAGAADRHHITITPAGPEGASAITLTVADADGATASETFVVSTKTLGGNSDGQTDARIIAAQIGFWGVVLTVVGSLVGAALAASAAFMGHRYKRAMDERNLLLKQSEEERQRLNTFVGSIGMLSTEDGKAVSPAQHAAVLLVLEKLGELSFAIKMLGPMWKAQQVETAIAGRLIDSALTLSPSNPDDPTSVRQTERLQVEAAILFHDHLDQLYFDDGSYEWPNSLDASWNTGLPDDARFYLLLTLMNLVGNRPAEEWNLDYLGGALIDLHVIAVNDPTPYMRVTAAQAARHVIRVLETEREDIKLPGEPDLILLRSTDDVDSLDRRLGELISGIEQEHAAASRPVADLEDWLQILKEWAHGEEEIKGSDEEEDENAKEEVE